MSQADFFESAQDAKRADLINKVVWCHSAFSPQSAEILSLAIDAFPSLKNFEKVNNGQLKADAFRIGNLCPCLLEVGDADGVISFLNQIATGVPEGYPVDEDHLDQLNDVMIFLSAHYQKIVPQMPSNDSWMDSNERISLKRILNAIEPIYAITDNFAYRSITSVPMAKIIYQSGDIEIFEYMRKRLEPHSVAQLLAQVENLWLAASKGLVKNQLNYLSIINDNKDHIGSSAKDKVVINFWNNVGGFIGMLDESKDEADAKRLFDVSTSVFNISSISSVKKSILQKSLFGMLLGMSEVAILAKNHGILKSLDDYRKILLPLECFGNHANKLWIPFMGDQYDKYKNNMKNIFSNVDIDRVFTRALPKNLSSMLSEVLDDTRWIGKTNVRNRGEILHDDLGL